MYVWCAHVYVGGVRVPQLSSDLFQAHKVVLFADLVWQLANTSLHRQILACVQYIHTGMCTPYACHSSVRNPGVVDTVLHSDSDTLPGNYIYVGERSVMLAWTPGP